ncbi:MAG: threonine synthase [Gemmatimonadetes bacterium]|nr:threonine synthase [Gemmatimonadota bacterium]
MNCNSWFVCINCDETYPLTEIVYTCKSCGGLLQVQHDMKVLQMRSGEEWKTLFDQRYMRTSYPYGSGVWGKKEMVCPLVEDENVVSTYEGGSNLFWADRLGSEIGLKDLWIKQCGNSHTGSFKDLGMTVLVSMVNQMISEGIDIPAVACASTGDTSAALAAYCAAADIPSIVLLPKNMITTSQLIQPIANGSLTISLRTDFDGCMRLVREISQRENIYLANSMNSLRIEGQKTVAIELVQQFDWEVPDWIIIPGGNLGNVSALGKGLLEMRDMGIISRLPRIAVGQAEQANPLYRSYLNDFNSFEPVHAGETMASAIKIGDPVSRDRAIRTLREFDGVVEQASESELVNACARADRTGLFTCPHTGVALVALYKLLQRGEIKTNERVVVVSTAHGLKFPDFKVRYHEGALAKQGIESPYLNEPIEVDAEYEKVRAAILTSIEQR